MGTLAICPHRVRDLSQGGGLCWTVGVACVGVVVVEPMRAGMVYCSPATARISLLSRAPPIPTVPAGTTQERELGQP